VRNLSLVYSAKFVSFVAPSSVVFFQSKLWTFDGPVLRVDDASKLLAFGDEQCLPVCQVLSKSIYRITF